MGTPRDVTADGRVYSVVDDLTVEHRLAVRGRVTDAATALPLGGRVSVRSLHPQAYATVRPGAEYLVAVGGKPPTVVRVRFTAARYASRTVVLTVPTAGTITTVPVQLKPRRT